MSALYGEPVFDEWVLVALADNSGSIQRYEGPRATQFLASFAKDIATLRAELAKQELDVGGFTFGTGTHGHTYDAAMRIGPAGMEMPAPSAKYAPLKLRSNESDLAAVVVVPLVLRTR